VRVVYSGLPQSVFRLDRVKSSSCDSPVKIPMDSNASGFTFYFSYQLTRSCEVLSECA
jgi:hypothetical protein